MNENPPSKTYPRIEKEIVFFNPKRWIKIVGKNNDPNMKPVQTAVSVAEPRPFAQLIEL